MTRPAIVWLRGDLRLDDQPAIRAVAGRPALFVYIHDEATPGLRPLGGASGWWLAHSLASLREQIAAVGGRLDVLRGPQEALILSLARISGATKFFGRADTAARRSKSTGAQRLRWQRLGFREKLQRPVAARTLGGRQRLGRAVQGFSPFWRRHRALGPLPAPLPAPERLTAAPWPIEARRASKSLPWD